LDPAEGALVRNGVRIKLQDLPTRLLVMLVERPEEIVTREEVRRRLWPENTFVEFDNSLGVAVRKIREALNDDADEPRFVETIPRRGYRFLVPVTVIQPVDAQTTEILASPGPAMVDARTVLVTNKVVGSRRQIARWVIPILTVSLLAGIIYFLRPIHNSPSKINASNQPVPVHVRRSVAVLGFRNLPGRAEDNWLSPALAEMLNTELGAEGSLRMVSGEDVARAKRELPITEEDSLAKSTLERLRDNIDADLVVVGSYTLLPGKNQNLIRLDMRLQDAIRGETIAEEAVTGDENNLFQVAELAGVRLRQDLGLSSMSAGAASEAHASLPSNQKAIKLYAEGRTSLWALDNVHARDFLAMAVAADPDFALAHSDLSYAWDRLGYVPKARAEAKRALDLSQRLPKEQRLLIEGRYHSNLADWPRAVEIYRELWGMFPDSLDYGLLLANAQRWVKPEDALKTLTALSSLPSPIGDDPRIDLAEASALTAQNLGQAEAAAQRAIAKGKNQGSHHITAVGYGILCQIGAGAVSDPEATNNCENARRSYEASGDFNNAARTLSDLAGIYYQHGDLAKADAMWRDASTVFRRVGDVGALAATVNNRGDVLLLQGELNAAEKLLQESIPLYKAVDDKTGLALVLTDLAELAHWKGNFATAETTYQQARATADEIGDKVTVSYVFFGMGELLADRGDISGARKEYEQALELRDHAGQTQSVAETKLALAQLSIDQGKYEGLESEIRKYRDQFYHDRQTDDELTASTVLTEVLLGENKLDDAGKEIEAGRALAAKSQNRFARLQLSLATARYQLATNQSDLSRQELQNVLQDARSHGFVGVEFEAQLLTAQLTMKDGHVASAREQLMSLERDARTKGFGLIAQKAAAARS
jgi:eukaryotic-like serine/threonine-protein kinase